MARGVACAALAGARLALFTVPGKPVPKARPRIVTAHAVDGRRFNRSYTPARTRAYEEAVGWAALQALRHAGAPAPAPAPALYGIHVRFVVSAKHWLRFDIDNALKSLLDGMQGVVYPNDRQVIHVCATLVPLSSIPGGGKDGDHTTIEITTHASA